MEPVGRVRLQSRPRRQITHTGIMGLRGGKMSGEFDGRCVRCKWRQSQPGSVLCEECLLPEHTPSSAASQPIHAASKAQTNAANQQRGMGCVLWGIGIFIVLGLIGQCMNSGGRTTPSTRVPSEDRAAYNELRGRGYSEKESRDAAGSIRRLCEAGGGTDCR